MIDAFSPLSLVQSLLGAVEVRVTRLAIGDGLDILDDFVLDFHVALVAFDFIFGNMFGVHQVCVFVLFQSLPFPMALIAIFSWDFTIAYDGVAVAFITGKTVVKHHRMVITRCRLVGESFFVMTVSAVIDLREMLAFFEMTDEAGAFGHRNVFTLDNLRMTACAL